MMSIIIPIEGHNQLLVQCVILLNSARKHISRDYEVFIVNHNNSEIPSWFNKRLNENEKLINVSLTNDKFYYNKESYFLLMPEVLKYINDTYPIDDYLFLDPDSIITEDFTTEATADVDVFKTPLNKNTELLLYMFNLELPKKIQSHYDTFCLYSNNKDFITDWYNTSVDIAKYESINIKSRFEHFCEELAISLLSDKYNMVSNVSCAYLDKEPDDLKPIYHYDNLKNVYNSLDKADRLLIDIKLRDEELGDNKDFPVLNDIVVINKEIKEYVLNGTVPLTTEAKRTLRYNTPYEFID